MTERQIIEAESILYGISINYNPIISKEYPTLDSWHWGMSYNHRYLIEDIAEMCASAVYFCGIAPEQFMEELHTAFDNAQIPWEKDRFSVIDDKIRKKIEANKVKADWKKALSQYTRSTITSLSHIIEWSFSDKDISILAQLHKNGGKDIRYKIEALLEDCNFHTECAKFEAGEYEDYLPLPSPYPGVKKLAQLIRIMAASVTKAEWKAEYVKGYIMPNENETLLDTIEIRDDSGYRSIIIGDIRGNVSTNGRPITEVEHMGYMFLYSENCTYSPTKKRVWIHKCFPLQKELEAMLQNVIEGEEVPISHVGVRYNVPEGRSERKVREYLSSVVKKYADLINKDSRSAKEIYF